MSKRYISLDEAIKEALRKRAEEANDINLDAAWDKFNNKYNTQQKYFPMILTIACSFIVILVTAGIFMPSEGRALNLKFFESIKSFISGKVQVAQLSFNNEKGKNTLDSLDPEASRVFKSVPYEILLPVDLMGLYTIESPKVKLIGDSIFVSFILSNSDSSKILVSEVNIIEGVNQGNAYDTEDAVMNKVNIKGQDASLFTYKNGIKKLCWVDRDLLITISGSINEDSLIELANSLRRVTIQ